ncbi:hypothetical protein KAR91_71330 [Candidatus Pacearchaeota archaeon]|nr:hypothetical protein [Candidatus Pacearchaeota archaeon]
MAKLSYRAQCATENLVLLRSAHKNISQIVSWNEGYLVGITLVEQIRQLETINKFIKRIEAILAEEVKC